MIFHSPYDKWELLMATCSLRDKNFDEAIIKEVSQKIKAFLLEEIKERNQRIAEDNGITVLELINSPNYQILVKEYEKRREDEVVQVIMEKLDITKVQFYAIIANDFGALD